MQSLILIPYAFAADNASTLGTVLNPIISNIVYPILELFFAVAIVIFIWGVLQIILHGEDEEARKKGKYTMLYGVLGLFIMVSAWGIVYLIANTIKAAIR
jgi:hypothetical protein